MKSTNIQWFLFSTIFMITNFIFIGIVGMAITSLLFFSYLVICNPFKFDFKIKDSEYLTYLLGIIVLGGIALPYLYYFSNLYSVFDVTSLPLAGQAAQRVVWKYFGSAPLNGPQLTGAKVLSGSYILSTVFVGITFPALAHSIKHNLNTETLRQLHKANFVNYKVNLVVIILCAFCLLRIYPLKSNALTTKQIFVVISPNALFSGPTLYVLSVITVTSLYLSLRISRG